MSGAMTFFFETVATFVNPERLEEFCRGLGDANMVAALKRTAVELQKRVNSTDHDHHASNAPTPAGVN
jgi:hypothetical protein